jgi:hypothetical protein
MRTNKLEFDGKFQSELNCVRQNSFYCKGDNSKKRHAEHFYVLVGRMNEMNTYVGRKMQFASETDVKIILNRNMLFGANFVLHFGFIEQVLFDELFEEIENWMLNDKALMITPVTINEDQGRFCIEGLLNTDAEYEDDIHVICTVFDLHLAKALQLFLNWFHEEMAHYEKFRNAR